MEHKTLGIELDKKGSSVYIKHSHSLAYTPAYTFFIRQIADLIDNKHGRPYTSWEDDNCELIWAEIDNEVVAILCYNTQYVFRKIPYIAIILTAVKENFRQRGIHTMMNRYFEKRAIDLNCLAIRATVHLTNDVRLKSTEKDNLKPLLTTMYKKL
jgi:hypothetical protein